MGDVPEALTVHHAVIDLCNAMGEALRDTTCDTADPEALAVLAGQLSYATDQLRWCRDAALHLARRSPHPEHRAEWQALELHTGVSDATLEGRRNRWHHRNREVR